MGRNRDVMLRTRAEWRRAGVCTRCGKGEAESGHTRCGGCLAYDVERFRKNSLAAISSTAHTTHGSLRFVS